MGRGIDGTFLKSRKRGGRKIQGSKSGWHEENEGSEANTSWNGCDARSMGGTWGEESLRAELMRGSSLAGDFEDQVHDSDNLRIDLIDWNGISKAMVIAFENTLWST